MVGALVVGAGGVVAGAGAVVVGAGGAVVGAGGAVVVAGGACVGLFAINMKKIVKIITKPFLFSISCNIQLPNTGNYTITCSLFASP